MPVDFKITGVEGLADLARDLRAIDAKLPKQLQQVNKKAVDTIAGKARSAYQSQYSSKSGAGAGSIRAVASQTRGQIALGSGRAPYPLGQEFGSGQGLNKKQFPPYNAGRGNFFYPTIRAEAEGLPEAYGDMLDDMLRANGFR